MTDAEFLAAFEAGSLDGDRFHHADHLHAAWLYLKRFPAADAITRFSRALRAYAATAGKAERYHETITWAYLLLMNERMARGNAAETWEDFAAANADLLDWKHSVLRQYYREETLESEEARRLFLMPDM